MSLLSLLLVVAVIAVPVSADAGDVAENARPRVGAGAVWKAGPHFMDKVHASCGSLSYPQLGECLVLVMKQEGASPEAVRFTQSMDNEAWLRSFRETGGVDIAYVTYPFRANENQGVLLVNGDPARIDVDGPGMPNGDDLKTDLVYQGLERKYPAVSFWPGDRFGTDTPAAEPLAGAGSRFHVGYLLRNGCHACEEIGSAVFAFDFDATGQFLGSRLMTVTDMTKGVFSDPSAPVSVEAGKEFSLVLASNPTTGYQWNLAAPLDESVLGLSGKDYSPSAPGVAGAGGTETWTFRAKAAGRSVIFMSYGRPWEKGIEPLRHAAFVILVR